MDEEERAYYQNAINQYVADGIRRAGVKLAVKAYLLGLEHGQKGEHYTDEQLMEFLDSVQ